MSGYSSTKLKIGIAGDVLDILERYVSRIAAGSLFQQALRTLTVAEGQLRPEHVARLVDELVESAKLFCDAQKLPALLADLQLLKSRHARRA